MVYQTLKKRKVLLPSGAKAEKELKKGAPDSKTSE